MRLPQQDNPNLSVELAQRMSVLCQLLRDGLSEISHRHDDEQSQQHTNGHQR